MAQLAPKGRLILDAAIDDASITGTLTAPSGAQRAFHGWIELGTAIEALLTAEGRPGEPAGDSSDRGAE
jgi:hypothetical protein